MNRFNTELPRIELPEPPRTNWFSKYHLWGYAFLVLTFLLIVSFIYQMEYNKKPQESRICIQVVTTARSPYSGETKDFPTPCDVPEGWEVVPGVYNEIPGIQVETSEIPENYGPIYLEDVSGEYINQAFNFSINLLDDKYVVEQLNDENNKLVDFTSSDLSFRYWLREKGTQTLDSYYFFDQEATGSGQLSGKDARIFVNTEGYCDGPGCGSPYVAYVTEHGKNFLILYFTGDAIISEKESLILKSFKQIE